MRKEKKRVKEFSLIMIISIILLSGCGSQIEEANKNPIVFSVSELILDSKDGVSTVYNSGKFEVSPENQATGFVEGGKRFFIGSAESRVDEGIDIFLFRYDTTNNAEKAFEEMIENTKKEEEEANRYYKEIKIKDVNGKCWGMLWKPNPSGNSDPVLYAASWFSYIICQKRNIIFTVDDALLSFEPDDSIRSAEEFARLQAEKLDRIR